MPISASSSRSLSAESIVLALEALYGRVVSDDRYDPMEELVSCILSQHTNDKNSYPAFDRLRGLYPDWEVLEKEDPAQVASIIASAGLAKRKTELIQACLRSIREERGEYSIDFLRHLAPDEAMEWLQKLPGVGPKTAALVLCFQFWMPVLPVDVHVHRVSQRLGLIKESTDANRAHSELAGWVPGVLVERFHLALIQHGRGLCRARRPRCEECPLAADCDYWRRAA